MKKIVLMSLSLTALMAAVCGCGKKSEFKYTIDEFADLQVLRYRIPGWDELSLKQKKYVYHLGEAAKWGRDIIWDQNCECNLDVRHMFEAILERPDKKIIAEFPEEWNNFVGYAKRVFFSNGIHHHYAEYKLYPECRKAFMVEMAQAAGVYDEDLINMLYDWDRYPVHTATDGDLVKNSSVNFYYGTTTEEVNAYYEAKADPNDPHPISYGLNTKLWHTDDGSMVEQVWKVGGKYGHALEKVCAELKKAAKYAESPAQAAYIEKLIEYYNTGDLRLWDEFNVMWVQDHSGSVDFVNGFVEDYDDPLGRKASWEGIVDIKDHEASRRTEIISANAQWFEDNAPMDQRFKKAEVKGVSASVVNVTTIAGDNYPATAIGINLPNADWIRREYGSKSVTIGNLTQAYDLAAQERPQSTLTEFCSSQEEIDRAKKYGTITSDVHTDLHECLGHGSGQILPGVPANSLKEFSSTLEEARADIFGLYYMADPKLVELGILPDGEAYKAAYDQFIRNGIMVQFSRIGLGGTNTEAHMQDRQLIAQWCYEQGLSGKVIEKIVRDGKTYFKINDYEALRGLFGKLLAELQRIKSEGDYAAGKALVEKYAVNIDPDLHKEVRDRYAALGLKPYSGFVNPEIKPVKILGITVNYRIVYVDDFLQQQLDYGKKYRAL